MLQNLSDYQAEILSPTNPETTAEFLRVGKLLYEVRQLFGSKELDALIQDTGLKRKGRYWLAIYDLQVRYKLDESLLEEVGWTKVKMLMESGELEGTKSALTKALRNAMDYSAHELDNVLRRGVPTVCFRADLESKDMAALRTALEAFGLKYGPRGMLNAPLALMNLTRYAMKHLAAENAALAKSL